MWKALLRKQFLELHQTYFQNKKTGQRRSKGKTVGFIVLMALVCLLLAGSFLSLGSLFATTLYPQGLGWLHFTMMGLIAIVIGVVGDVASTYAGMYRAKDNELLLSMPIPPVRILSVRLIGVYVMGLLYTALVWIPGAVAYWIWGEATVACVVLSLLLLFLLSFLVLVLTCLLGWVVALISARLKNKAAVTALLVVAVLAGYYWIYFRLVSYLQQDFLLHADVLGGKVRSWAWPLYALGQAACGDGLSFAAVAGINLALVALTIWALSRSFLRLATENKGDKHVAYREKTIKVRSVKQALFRRELKRFTSSATYMVNGGLGLVILVALAVFVVIKAPMLRELATMAQEELPELAALLPLLCACALMFTGGMNVICAPSVSLEGRSISLIQSLPVAPRDVLNAKKQLQVTLNVVPMLLCAVALGVALQFSAVEMALMVALTVIFVCFSADYGLMLGLMKPNLTWTSEVVPIKQSSSVVLAFFGAWVLALALGAGGWFTRHLITPTVYLTLCAALMGAGALFIRRWLDTRGAEIFAAL